MALENASPPLDEKAKRTRELLASFYSTNASTGGGGSSNSSGGRPESADSVNSPNFDPDVYMSILVHFNSISFSPFNLLLSRSDNGDVIKLLDPSFMVNLKMI
ncbi:hypothetical protein KSP40_PGU018337 [Platanthera guangdongensis]|uniref:Uncharacterized protein n=1 Tax=Platanthera guangdongensis TaxID=2320717 RepID=A0ABR2LLH2_9ASPA